MFHLIAQNAFADGFSPNLEEKNFPRVHIIYLDKLCDNLFKGFDFTRGYNFHFPIG